MAKAQPSRSELRAWIRVAETEFAATSVQRREGTLAVRNMYTNIGQLSGDQHPRRPRRPSARLHDDLYVAAEQDE